MTTESPRISEEVSKDMHEGGPLQLTTKKNEKIVLRNMAPQNAPHPSNLPLPPALAENSSRDASNTSEPQGSFGEQLRHVDKQLSTGTSLRNVEICSGLK